MPLRGSTPAGLLSDGTWSVVTDSCYALAESLPGRRQNAL
ncbi:hypothetical protein HMPREF9593_02578 [Cutibacterium acnes HL046PA2]|nr:hypothetical protein HMPREF9593_02578 [Cutibacterium acnes HL046PA2]